MFFPSRSFLGGALLLLPALAQAQSDPAPSSLHPAGVSPQRAAEVLPAVLPVVPIHDEQTVDGQREVWTAGSDFKASFHDGFAFYPRGGADRPRAFRWRTVAVEVGGRALIAPASVPVPRYTADRCAFDHGAVIEAYEVRAEGVEQTFTLPERPLFAGDLVVHGRVGGDFAAPRSRIDAQQALDFTADGALGVRYGAATAVDAAGRRAPMTTAFDGTHVTLRLESEWLAEAHYPVVVDPLTTARGLSGYAGASSPWRDVSIAHDPYADQYLVLATLDNPWDRDVYGYLCNRDFTSSDLVYAFNGTDDFRVCDVAFVAAPRRWLVLVGRRFQARHYLGLHSRDSGSTTLASVPVTLSSPVRSRFRPARIGGTTSRSTGQRALVSYADSGEYRGFYVDVFSSGFWAWPSFPIASVGTQSRYELDVSDSGSSSEPWLVAVYDENRPYYLVKPHLVQQTGSRVDASISYAEREQVQAIRVAGSRGRGVVAWGLSGKVAARELTWDTTGTVPGSYWRESGSQTALLGAAMDEATRSHWAVLYETYRDASGQFELKVARLGHSLGTVESQRLQLRTAPIGTYARHSGDVVYGARGFGCAYSFGSDSVQQIRGRRLVHDPTGGTSSYGSSCGSGWLYASGYEAGNENFRVTAMSLPWGVPVTVFGSMRKANLPLPGGCTQLIDPAQVFVANTGMGTVNVSYPLPDRPVLIGDLYFQALYMQGGMQRATRGLEVRVRP